MYVQRDGKGRIVAAYTGPQFRTQERVENNDPALLRYLGQDVLAQTLFASVGLSIDDIALLATRLGKYVERGVDEEIISATDAPTRDFQERAPLDSADLVAFTNQEPPEPEPKGFRYQHAAAGWRILGLNDGSVLAQGLPNREACVTFMRGIADRRKQGLNELLAKSKADRDA